MGRNNCIGQRPEPVEAIEKASCIEANKIHGPEVPGDVSKAKKLLGYNPNYDLEEGLKDFVGWYRKENNDHEKITPGMFMKWPGKLSGN